MKSFHQESGKPGQDVFEYYRQLNKSEPRLYEFKDNDEVLRLKISQLDVINASRKKYRAQPVKLDILASRVANKMCREAAENNYISHWNMAGEKPYQRYAFAGGVDHVSENAFGEWTSGEYSISDTFITEMMKTGHSGFMKEKAPNDGHKKNIIDKTHNWAGIGLYVSKNQFRYYEEFVNRYLEFSDIPSELKVGEAAYINVDAKGEGYLYFITIYREKFPQPMKLSQLKKTGIYEDYSEDLFQTMPSWDLAGYRKGTSYHIPLRFSKEGLYYIQIFTDPKEDAGSHAITTKGKSPVSGIVITVRK